MAPISHEWTEQSARCDRCQTNHSQSTGCQKQSLDVADGKSSSCLHLGNKYIKELLMIQLLYINAQAAKMLQDRIFYMCSEKGTLIFKPFKLTLGQHQQSQLYGLNALNQ